MAARPAIGAAIAFLVVLVAMVATVGALSMATTPTLPENGYAINGLSCSFPQGTPAYVQGVVRGVIQSAKFTAAVNGSRYVFVTFDNMTERVQTVGNVTTKLPDALELGFSTRGAATSCSGGAIGRGPDAFTNWIDVQVPIINGTFQGAQETVGSLGGPK